MSIHPRFLRFVHIVLWAILCAQPTLLHASETARQTLNTRQELAQEFLSRMKDGFRNAERFMRSAGIKSARLDLRGLPEGDQLLFEMIIPPRLHAEGAVFGKIHEGTVLLSLRDFIQILEFPITYNEETKTYAGWFIRENKSFNLNLTSSVVQVGGQEYSLGQRVLFQDNDVFVPFSNLGAWFGIAIDVDISTQQLTLDPLDPLPVTERYSRRQKNHSQRIKTPPFLPLADDGYDLIDTPFIDISTRSTLRDRTDQARDIEHSVNIRTAGELAYGTLNTNISANNQDQITSVRASYLRESKNPELLGALKARRFELGDLQPTRLPLTGSAPPEMGVRITNTDPLVHQRLSTTQISGYIFPGWDVELYREKSLLFFRETNEDGYYSFDNVPLLTDRNFFRIVAYGPQGEIREEAISVPFDIDRVATEGSIYDVSVTLQDRQAYRKFESKDKDNDNDTPHIVGFYETPITKNTALQLGIRHRQEKGQQKTYANLGLSTTYKGALINTTIASDEQGEMASELVLRRQFGPHSFRGDLNLATDNYNPGQSNVTVETLSTIHSLEGPLPFSFGDNPRYAASLNYNQRADGETFYGGFLSLNTQFQKIGINQSLGLSDASANQNGPNSVGTTSVSGSFGKNFVRGLAQYSFTPKQELESLSAFWKRQISETLETQLQVDRTIEDNFTRYSTQVNWRPDYITITPRISYDSGRNLEAILSARFGVARVPGTGHLAFTRDSFTNLGSLSAFVFLDKDGDLQFGGEDEPIEDARIVTPQNSGGGKTNADGVAYISQLRPNVITDVFLEPGSLSDPYWMPARQGVSIMPRTGTSIKMDFPVHIAGEMDGTVYADALDGSHRKLGGVVLDLYNDQGEIVKTTATGPDGFYIFELLPPGGYILMVDANTIPANMARPLPEVIKIGYEGTIIYSHDIFIKSGHKDVPSTILASLDKFKERHPHISIAQGTDIVLNLGSYNSKLMMAFAWHKLARNYSSIFMGGKLLASPKESFADINSSKHQLRYSFSEETIEGAYDRCRVLIEKKLFCDVEILPGAIEKYTTKNL